MPLSPSVDRFVQKTATIGPRLQRGARNGVFGASLLITESVRAELVSAGVQGGRLRGVGTRGAKIGVGFDVKGLDNPTSLVRMRGPAHLLERPTKPHEIAVRRRGKVAMPTPYGFRTRVHHPGTRGKHPWERGVVRSLPAARSVLVKTAGTNVFRSVFG